MSSLKTLKRKENIPDYTTAKISFFSKRFKVNYFIVALNFGPFDNQNDLSTH